MTFQTLNRDTDPSVTASYYACPVTGTRNITISLNFKGLNILPNLPSALTTLSLKAFETASLKSLEPVSNWNLPKIEPLTTAQLQSLCALPTTLGSTYSDNKQWLNKETYGHKPKSDFNYVSPFEAEKYHDPNFFKDWWNKDINHKPATDSDRLDFALKSLEKSFDKDKKKETIKQIQKLLENLLD